MSDHLPQTITVSEAVPAFSDGRAFMAGGSYVDDQDRRILRLGLEDASGDRDISLVEGDTFEFAGATWRVAKVYEPAESSSPGGSTGRGGLAGELIRISSAL